MTSRGNVAFIDVRNAALLNGGAVSGLMLGALRTPPDFNNFPFLDPTTGLQRSYRFPHPGASSLLTSRGYDNALFALNNNPNLELTDRTTANIGADWQAAALAEGRLHARRRLLRRHPDDRVCAHRERFPEGTRAAHDGGAAADRPQPRGDRDAQLQRQRRGHATLGQNLNSRRVRDLSVTGSDLIAPQPFAINNTVTQASSEGLSTIHTESYFGQVTSDSVQPALSHRRGAQRRILDLRSGESARVVPEGQRRVDVHESLEPRHQNGLSELRQSAPFVRRNGQRARRLLDEHDARQRQLRQRLR